MLKIIEFFAIITFLTLGMFSCASQEFAKRKSFLDMQIVANAPKDDFAIETTNYEKDARLTQVNTPKKIVYNRPANSEENTILEDRLNLLAKAITDQETLPGDGAENPKRTLPPQNENIETQGPGGESLNPIGLAHLGLGAAYKNKGKIDESILEFKDAIRINPNHIESYVSLGAAYGLKGMIDEARSEFIKAIEIDINEAVSSILLMGILKSKYTKTKIDEVEAHMKLGDAYNSMENFKKAKLEYENVLKLEPDHSIAKEMLPEVCFDLGYSYLMKGKFEDAIIEFNKTLEIKSDFPQIKYVLEIAHYNLGINYAKNKELDKAILEFNNAISINPKYAVSDRKILDDASKDKIVTSEQLGHSSGNEIEGAIDDVKKGGTFENEKDEISTENIIGEEIAQNLNEVTTDEVRPIRETIQTETILTGLSNNATGTAASAREEDKVDITITKEEEGLPVNGLVEVPTPVDIDINNIKIREGLKPYKAQPETEFVEEETLEEMKVADNENVKKAEIVGLQTVNNGNNHNQTATKDVQVFVQSPAITKADTGPVKASEIALAQKEDNVNILSPNEEKAFSSEIKGREENPDIHSENGLESEHRVISRYITINYKTESEYSELIEKYEDIIRNNPYDSNAHYKLAYISYTKAMQFDVAIARREGVLENNQNFLVKRFYLTNVIDDEDISGIGPIKQSETVENDNGSLHGKLGNVYEERGLFNDAISEYKIALKTNPDYSKFLYGLAFSYFGKASHLDIALNK